MPEIRPFRGLRYSPEVELPLAVAPPYDVINADERARLAERPRNVVRLILSEPGPAGDAYAQAAATLHTWRNSGILALDPKAAFYVYAQTFHFLGAEPLTRAGVIGAVTHGRDVWGHERTHQGPKDDRFALLAATQTNLSCIFGLAEDADGALDTTVEEAMQAAPAADFTDDARIRHRLWVETDPARCAAIQSAIRQTSVVIADGHHRYETAATYAQEVGGPGSDAVMMMCVSLKSRGLRVYPYHRVLRNRLHALTEDLTVVRSAFPGWTIEEVAGPCTWPDTERRLLAQHVEAHAFALYTGDRCLHLSRPRDPNADVVSGLDVTVLQHEVFERAWRLDVEALNADGALTYTPDGEEAMRRVDTGHVGVAILVNPTPTESVVACASTGQRMPQKSTYFYPKLLTGLVLRSLPDDPAEGG